MNEEVWKRRRKSVLLLTILFKRENGRYSRKFSEIHSCRKMGGKNLAIFQKKWGENAFFGRKPLFFLLRKLGFSRRFPYSAGEYLYCFSWQNKDVSR